MLQTFCQILSHIVNENAEKQAVRVSLPFMQKGSAPRGIFRRVIAIRQSSSFSLSNLSVALKVTASSLSLSAQNSFIEKVLTPPTLPIAAQSFKF